MSDTLCNESATECGGIIRLHRIVKSHGTVGPLHNIWKHAHGTLVSGNDTILRHIMSAELHAGSNTFEIDIGIVNANK